MWFKNNIYLQINGTEIYILEPYANPWRCAANRETAYFELTHLICSSIIDWLEQPLYEQL